MALKDLLGDAYKEGMSAEEIEKALESVSMPDMSKYVPKSQYDKASTDASDWKKKYRSTLDDAEQQKIKAEEDAKKDRDELEALRKKVKVGEYQAEFLKRGYDEKTAIASAEALYAGDMETVFKNLGTVLESTKKSAQKDLLNQTPPPPTGHDGKSEPNLLKMSLSEMQAYFTSNGNKF